MRTIILFLLLSSTVYAFDFPWGADRWQGASGTAPTTYGLTLAIVGDSTLTIESTGYTSSGSPHTITGLSGITSMDVTYGGTDDTTVFTGTDSGDVTGTSPNFFMDFDADKSLICTFSTASTCSTSVYAVTGTVDTKIAIGDTDATYYLGALYNEATQHTICGGSVVMEDGIGDISTKTITVYVYADNAGDLGSLVGQFESFAGVETWDFTTVNYDAVTPFVLSASTNYWIVITMDEFGAVFPRLCYASGQTGVTLYKWNGDKTLNATSANSFAGFTLYE